MLTPVTRHGFTFHEAAPSNKPAIDDEAGLTPREIQSMLAPPRIQYTYRAREEEARRKRPDRRRALSNLGKDGTPPENIPDAIKAIQNAAMTVWEVSSEKFFGPARQARIASARITSMALCRIHLGVTWDVICLAHRRDRGSAIHALTAYKAYCENEQEFRINATKIFEIVKQGGVRAPLP